MMCRNDYAEACRELRCILRAVYVYAPISFQALLYEDVEHAFHTLSKYVSGLNFNLPRCTQDMVTQSGALV